jgi:predicted RNA-binding Zn-ribbon protein involved in translation (DUF1610 family)
VLRKSTPTRVIENLGSGRHEMKVTCDSCDCDMKITSSFRYHCPQCNNEMEMAHVQELNRKYREEHKKNIEWLKIRDKQIIVES